MCGAASGGTLAVATALAGGEAADCEVHGPNRPLLKRRPSSQQGQPSSCHVLLVDDERLTRTVLSSLLLKCGYRVTSASDGLEALRLLRGSAPDTFQLVLTDVCMPELNGIQLLSCVKQDANLRAVPVVMMSSVDQEETVAECVQQGAEEYLVKPVTKKEVQHIWQHVWRKRCAAAQVPQLPLEAAAAAAAAAGAAALWQQQQAAAAAAPPAEAPAQPQAPHAPQDVQQPASAGGQVQADSVDALVRSAPQAAGAGGLHMRQSVFSAAVSLVQGAHLQRRPLLCLRPSHLLFSQLHGLSVAVPSPQQQGGSGDAAAAAEVDSLYVSPDEAAGHPTCQSDMFSLGLLFVDLFFPCASQEQRCAQLRAARAAVLPPVLRGTHGAGSAQAVQDLVLGLLQADPARRPTVHAVLRAGILQDAFRLVQQLPHWRLLGCMAATTAAQQQQQASAAAAAPHQQPAPAGSCLGKSGAAAAPATAALVGPLDHDAVRHFLLLLRKSKQQEVAQAQGQLAALDADIGDVRRRRSQDAQQPAAAAEEQPPTAKRARLEARAGGDGAAEPAAGEAAAAAAAAAPEAEPPAEQQQRVAAVMPQLEDLFFRRRQQQQRRQAQAPAACGGEAGGGLHLDAFARDLNELAAHSKLSLKATLRSGDLASPVEMACCAAFDRDDEFFATVGVSRRVKIFDFAACLEGQDSVMHYPALQITTRSKLSSVSWNSYVKSQLITSDYGGLIQLWDAATAGEAAQYDEHARRVWSVDFSTTDPMRFLSGSDDGSVRLWSVHEQASVARIAAPANVCSVQFSPADSHTIAFGCANYRVYLYDLRRTAHPLAVVCGPQRAVSYVKFLGGSHLVSASTDSTLRLWDLADVMAGADSATTSGASSAGSSGTRCRPACTYTGHRNQRNFVGLSVSPDGHILCGSEDNSGAWRSGAAVHAGSRRRAAHAQAVYSYYRSLPFSTAQYRFSPGEPAEGHQPFVSAVCWANRSRHCLAANSQGLLQILKLE
ncbi:hypothetical protein CHLNCDRAFT_142774 [Chlorella variabilis]|uniref:Response regulatory domain-containing protein n=1 Tax=Chlorella variabilis TaxID=554065 RepID=E1Z8Q4_CHLVA|nr:hypothetical protein CHLNCDRAFT_142774 [Chlorella variabilis]EFN57379.1 hypothetical protein CHLNCDRAFT_142774 [Chlorella variabilis]|eukprot:XP_005849481.1 hypothetical protein CHLNCDRAFT_142774 [Chlorella variabilis]